MAVGALDFDDLLIEARRLLVGGEETLEETVGEEGYSPIFAARKSGQSPSAELRRRLATHLRLLLIDEFQDTDRLQVELVKALCDHDYLSGKLFFVGDHKQSIYRFRGADPEVFRGLREEIADDWRLPLSENFRSQPAILEFVNGLFAQELPNYEPLVAHRTQVGPRPAVEFLWATETAEAATGDKAATAGRADAGREEAGATAGREDDGATAGRGFVEGRSEQLRPP